MKKTAFHQQKYNAIRTTVKEITFASKREAARYILLLELAKLGEITNLQLQPAFVLQEKFTYDGATTITTSKGKAKAVPVIIQAMKYIADFRYTDKEGNDIIEDVKGMPTTEFALKFKLFIYKYPHLNLRIIK